jgi:DNA-binding SARP family transcriptional activator/tetratricopeptide (TPR) repeat protein
MELRLWGPVEVARTGAVYAVRPPQQAAVLAALAVDAGRHVSTETLLARVWDDEDRPAQARRTVHTHLTRLRRLLERSGGAEHGVRLTHRSGGYQLDPGTATVDLLRFRRAVGMARQSGLDPGRRMALLGEALAYCRGEPLAGLPGNWAAQVREGCRQQHLDAVLAWAGAALACGRAAETVAPLTDLVIEHPLVEAAVAGLMRALHVAGRGPDALDRYAEARERLIDQLGADPGPDLRAAHREVLTGTPVAAPAPCVPAQLPLDAPGFAGREEQIARLDALLAEPDAERTVVISALSGTAGVGKTALAVHWAHRVRGRFPDGQLYVNLCGFDPTQSPTSPTAALRDCLDALGISAESIPDGVRAQANLYRTTVAERRMLVLLDNARDAEQVRPLLPGSGGCLVVVTSRNLLAGLVTAEGARPVTVDLLSTVEAVELLTVRLGAGRISREPSAVRQIVESCAGLPLALTIVAARLAINPELPLAHVAAELTGMRQRLDSFAGEDAATDVRTVFSWSYRILDADAARLFRLMGLLQAGPDIGATAAANLAGLSPTQVRPLLDRLVRGHLLAEPAPGRFAFHDLLRAYAAELAHATDTAPDRDSALGRLLDYYAQSAHAAAAILQYFDLAVPPAGPAEVHAEVFTSAEPALAWLVTERAALVATVGRAYDGGFFAHSWLIARNIQDFLVAQGHWHEMDQVQRVALTAARQTDDSAAQVSAHRALAHAQTLAGRHEQAEEHLRGALRLASALGDPVQVAYCEHNLAIVRQAQGRKSEALEHEGRALEEFQLAGDTRGVILTLNGMAWMLIAACEYEQALEYGHRALAVVRTTGAWPREATIRDTIAYAHLHLGHAQLAVDHFRQSLDLSRKAGNRYQEAAILARLGDAHQAGDELPSARTAWRQAIEILETLDQVSHQPRAHDGYNRLPDATSLRARLRGAQSIG